MSDVIAVVREIREAYSERVFRPLLDADVKKLVKAMGHNTDIGNPSDRLHAQWARKICDGILAGVPK